MSRQDFTCGALPFTKNSTLFWVVCFCLGDSVVLQTAIPVDPTLQVLQATPTPAGGIYTTPVGAAVVNYNSVPVGPALSAPPPQPAQDWYKEQKLTSAAYIQSE